MGEEAQIVDTEAYRERKREAGIFATMIPMLLSREHIAAAAAVMGRALVEDPLFVHVLPDAVQRARAIPLMMETSLRIGLMHGEVWTTPSPIAGVAAWMSPSHPKITEEDRDAAGWREVGAAWGAEAFARFQEFATDLRELPDQEPHWHLNWLCVEPRYQGQGIGSSLVRLITARADAERVACHLFTFAESNLAIYEHLGFRVAADTILPRTGLRLWIMVRAPAVSLSAR
jgi:ribosomal protein S18 acetylase RimI-like enzyme